MLIGHLCALQHREWIDHGWFDMARDEMTEAAMKAAMSARVRREWNEMKGKGLEGRKRNAMKDMEWKEQMK